MSLRGEKIVKSSAVVRFILNLKFKDFVLLFAKQVSFF